MVHSELYTIKWVTPRIFYQEREDSFGETFFEISYGVWDIERPSVYRKALEMIENGIHKGFPRLPWFNIPTKEVNTEIRSFINPLTGEAEQLESSGFRQFVRNFAMIWNWRPTLTDVVMRDLRLFAEEDPAIRKEWHRWYNQERYGAYIKPGFYKREMEGKVPIDSDEEKYWWQD